MDLVTLLKKYKKGERDFSGLEVRTGQVSEADLKGISLKQSKLKNVNFNHAFLDKADLSFADLSYADLEGCSLKNANLTGANLRHANLAGANLMRATLKMANLRGANLYKTTLVDADMSKANLRDADLNKSDMRGAILLDAVLGGVILPNTISNEQIRMARILEVSEEDNYIDAMKTWVDMTFMIEGLPGFDGGFELGLENLAVYLKRYGIDPYDDEGKEVINHFINHALNDWYGDFFRFNNCSICGRQFQPELNLDYAYQVLDSYHILCPACQVKY